MHSKMWSCKHHVEECLADRCDIDMDVIYDFDDPDNSFFLWLVCKDCSSWEPKEGLQDSEA